MSDLESLGLLHKVYGDFWLLGSWDCQGMWENSLIAKAGEDYKFQTDYEEEEEEDLCMECYDCKRESSDLDIDMEGTVDIIDTLIDMSARACNTVLLTDT